MNTQYSDRAFMHTEQAGVKVPLLQTAVMTGLVSFCILILTWLFDVLDGYKYALAALGIVPLAMWIFLQRRWLLLTAETVLNRDLSGDGVVGPVPPSAPRVIRVQLDDIQNNGHIHTSAIFELPADDAQLSALANGLGRGLTLSEKTWTGKGNPFSIAEFRKLCGVMLAQGIIQYRNEKAAQQGYEPTPKGVKFFEQYLTSPTPETGEA